MTILDEIQTSIGQHAEGAGSSVVDIGQRWGVDGAQQGGTFELRVVRGADERAVQVVFTSEIEGK
jgi:hypothetical protein